MGLFPRTKKAQLIYNILFLAKVIAYYITYSNLPNPYFRMKRKEDIKLKKGIKIVKQIYR